MDILSAEERSRLMSRIRGKNTRPELLVRSWLHRHGFRFRLHRRDLPGKPDIVLPKYNTVIFVHGCFWHKHEGCRKATTPKSNREFWEKKLCRNIERDKDAYDKLEEMGWKTLVIWECETCDSTAMENKITSILPAGELKMEIKKDGIR